MAKAKFLHAKKIDRKVYPKGVHSVLEGFEEHWYVKHLLKEGSVVMVAEDTAAEPDQKKPVEPMGPSKSEKGKAGKPAKE